MVVQSKLLLLTTVYFVVYRDNAAHGFGRQMVERLQHFLQAATIESLLQSSQNTESIWIAVQLHNENFVHNLKKGFQNLSIPLVLRKQQCVSWTSGFHRESLKAVS